MKKIFFLFVLCLSTLCVCSQTCEELIIEYQRLEAQYKNLSTLSEKKECVKQMELILRRGMEASCGFPQKWSKEVEQLKKKLYQSAVFTKSDYLFDEKNDVIKIGVKQKKNFTLVNYPKWLKLIGTDVNKNFEFLMEENVIPYDRIGIIEVEDGKKRYQCTITQKAAPLFANVTEHIGFGKEGGTSQIFIETNDTTWSVYRGDNKKWITVEKTDFGAIVECGANPDDKKRSSSIKIRFACGKTRNVSVEQSLGATILTVPKKSFSFDNYGGINDTVLVNCNYDQWSANTEVDWIKVKKKYGGISIECLPNNMASARTAIVKIVTDNADNMVENVTIIQSEAPSFLSVVQDRYNCDGKESVLFIPVETNIPNWEVFVVKGDSWTRVIKDKDNDRVKVHLERNDENASRTAHVLLYGKGKRCEVEIYQPNRGYKGRYCDYYEANGSWRFTWLSVEAGVMTSIGFNLSAMNVRWKPAELSLVNFNMNYNMVSGTFNIGWEPVVRGFLPVSRDGCWAAFAGMGAHVDFNGEHHFLLELGMEKQWNRKYSSRLFFKYNGGCSIGISFDLGSWDYKK